MEISDNQRRIHNRTKNGGIKMQKMYRHGDLLIKRTDKIPSDVEELKTRTLAHGEVTGHHHTLMGGKIKTFSKGTEPQYLLVEQESQLTHQEHKTILIEQGTYEIIKEREYSPFEEEIR